MLSDHQWMRLKDAFYDEYPGAYHDSYSRETKLYNKWCMDKFGGIVGCTQKREYFIVLPNESDWIKLLLSI